MVTKREALAAAQRWIGAERNQSGQRGTDEILEIIAEALSVDDHTSFGTKTGLIDGRLQTVHAALNVPIRLLTEEQIEMLRAYIGGMTPRESRRGFAAKGKVPAAHEYPGQPEPRDRPAQSRVDSS